MHTSRALKARFSQEVYLTKRSFEKQLDNLPNTAFQYYYQTKIKELQEKSSIGRLNDTFGFAQQNSAFRRYIRKEWELLSITKRRLYYAFFFHFTGINYRSLNNYELARVMEIPTPAISEYMLFRNKFKNKFDNIWHEENLGIKRNKNAILRRNSSYPLIGLISSTTNNQITELSKAEEEVEMTNLTRRFREMCRECRNVWSTHISEERKREIRDKWEEQKYEFELQLQHETKILDNNLKKVLKAKFRRKSLCIEKPVTHTIVESAFPTFLPYALNKKK